MHLTRYIFAVPPGWEALTMDEQDTITVVDHNSRRFFVINNDLDLPAGWEVRTTDDGRRFFVDHNRRVCLASATHVCSRPPPCSHACT